MKKELCKCGKMATWFYMPTNWKSGNPFYCDGCVHRGCTCQEDKNQPCCEYEHSKDGFKVGTDAVSILDTAFGIKRGVDYEIDMGTK